MRGCGNKGRKEKGERSVQLYFLATGGGITFGGGEPCLYSDFIKEFKTCCGEEWNITLETSLNVPFANLKNIFPVVNNYIVDIKDINNEIYKKYTGKINLCALCVNPLRPLRLIIIM